MASDNLMAMELMAMEQPWMFRPTFADGWITNLFTNETDTLAKALQKSISTESSDGDAFSAEMVESLFAKPEIAAPLQMPSASGCSENDAPVSKQRRSIPPSGAKITKRKSRASKRAMTTFITADPANFRQMVQQVTGVRFGGLNGQLPVAPVLKPEPQRSINWIQQGSAVQGFDTSAYFLDGSAASLMAPPHMASAVATNGGANATSIDLDSFCSFPTLESSKVM